MITSYESQSEKTMEHSVVLTDPVMPRFPVCSSGLKENERMFWIIDYNRMSVYGSVDSVREAEQMVQYLQYWHKRPFVVTKRLLVV